MNDSGNRLLMSDSLAGVVPELEDDIVKKLEDSIIISSFQLTCGDKTELLSGILLGCALENGDIKADIRLDTSHAFKWFKSFVEGAWRCEAAFLELAGNLAEIQGPFDVMAPKLTDVDRQTKMCTIGLDLVKVHPI